MQIPEHLIIHETEHWLINHRINSKLPGYLILSSKSNINQLSDLNANSLAEVGFLQAQLYATPN